MKALSTTDRMHTQATDCWISIGNLARAGAEFGEISPASRDHPDVHQVRWHLCAQAHEWDVCLEIATTLTQIAPERPFGWIHQARNRLLFRAFDEPDLEPVWQGDRGPLLLGQ